MPGAFQTSANRCCKGPCADSNRWNKRYFVTGWALFLADIERPLRLLYGDRPDYELWLDQISGPRRRTLCGTAV